MLSHDYLSCWYILALFAFVVALALFAMFEERQGLFTVNGRLYVPVIPMPALFLAQILNAA